MRRVGTLVVVCLAGVLSLWACKSATVQNFTDVPVVTASRASDGDDVVRNAVLGAGEKLKWEMTEPAPGEIVGTYTVGGHKVEVSIPYNAAQYSILYKNSEQMKFQDGMIHPKYNVWVGALNREIQARLGSGGETIAMGQPAKPAQDTKPASPAKVRPSPPPQMENLSEADDAGELKSLNLGRYYALAIGIDSYDNLPDLKTAVADARTVAQVLADDYDFDVKTLININRAQLIEALDRYVETLKPTDNLLIYYAGHGYRDEASNRGYWLPADATRDRRTYWVSNADISDTLKSLRAKHVMIVADSCYSGTLTRGAGAALRGPDYVQRMAMKRARVVLSSGGLEPVADSSGFGHSPFADAFVAALRDNRGVLDGTRMFAMVRNTVVQVSRQTPEFADISEAGHEGGDFLFVRTRPGT